MVSFFQCEAQPDQTNQDEGCADEDSPQPHFRFEMASMALDVLICDEVMQPVAGELAKKGSYNRCKVEIAN